jgi:hypothetical protein
MTEKMKDRMERFERIGFVLDSKEAAWLELYKRLKAYREEHGHANVPQRYEKDTALGFWVNSQRVRYKQGRLRDTRIKLLEQIGFEWFRYQRKE